MGWELDFLGPSYIKKKTTFFLSNTFYFAELLQLYGMFQ